MTRTMRRLVVFTRLVGYSLFRDPRVLKDGWRWLYSLRPGGKPFMTRLPWTTFPAIRWIKSYIRAGMNVFEYGSGASTLFFADRKVHLTSLEHSDGWVEVVEEALEPEKRKRTKLIFVPPEPKEDPDFRGYPDKEGRTNYRNYVTSIDEFPDEYFDLVVVDGRARNACARRAWKKVKPGGFLLLDDAQRPKYRPTHDLLSKYERLEFTGLSPHKLSISTAVAWRKPQ